MGLYDEDFDPYQAAQDWYVKFQRGSLSQRGGNFDWIGTNNKRLQNEFIDELKRLLGFRYKIRRVNEYFTVEKIEITKDNRSTSWNDDGR